ncbi:sodium-coupled neutral amino acid transporter 2-like [Xiphophorus hellerii]|uniref:sodium-coupled neutral amino acid transporter 2-like n=1 Tax=Xiphophorus hellerii TaxID=8084 RepID=UPI0013B391FA|nr:sodium-coupled neutral amino acid transporter 2-like [Xiphophorus hellerii]
MTDAPRTDDSSRSNSEDSPSPNRPLHGQNPDLDAESQTFLPKHNAGKNASVSMSVFNLGNAIMGSGVLGLSLAMANTGIALFV